MLKSSHPVMWVVLMLSLLFLQGCAGLLYEDVKYYDRSGYRKFDTPLAHAKPTKLTSEQLKKRGYVKVGRINVSYTIQECKGKKGGNCQPIKHTEDATSRLLREAAEKGGELVQLEKNNEITDAVRNTRTSCAQYGTGTHKETRYVYKPRVYGLGSDLVLEQVEVRNCLIWNTVGKGVVKQTSAGDIWRKEPDLARLEALEAALESGTYRQVKSLLKGTDGYAQLLYKRRYYPLYVVLKKDNVSALRALIDTGMPVDAPVPYTRYGIENKTNQYPPIIKAIEEHAVNSVELLLKRGVDPNSPPILPVAIIKFYSSKADKSMKTIELLMKYGADPSKPGTYRGFEGMNAFDAADDRYKRRGFINKSTYNKILSVLDKRR